LAVLGCGGEAKIDFTSSTGPPSVHLVRPPVRKIVRVVGQPSFVEAYERSSIYPKMSAYIQEWLVDIGDKVNKGDILATLFVPEVVEDLGTKRATVVLDKRRVDLAEKVVEVTQADVQAAEAQLEEAEAILADYQSQVDRWQSEVERLGRETKRGVVDPQVLLESQNQLKASTAARDKAKATIAKARAELLSEQTTLVKTKIDVDVARADLLVAESEVKRLEAWVGYLKLPSPFDGVIVARNANTFDFVLPATGDPTADPRLPHLAPGGQAAPIYVVDRTDIVRVFVDIPERDADYVDVGTRATVEARAYRNEEIEASVTRTSWALNPTSRTLRAEIDLPNTDGQIRPGMYAYGNVIIERPGVRAVPVDAIDADGDQTFCWIYRDGKAVRTEVETGVSDGEWIEVTRREVKESSEAPRGRKTWTSIDGSEQVILGDLSLLEDGESVQPTSQP
jgi:multidrug efflux pump subunit AcrA (membrane-fusion protein)